jgi:hypothetical protein
VVLAEQDRPAVALAQVPGFDQLERLFGQVEQSNQVGDGNPAAPDAPADLLLREAEVVDEHRAGACLLDGVQVLPRHVLGEGDVEPLPVVGLAQHRGDQLDAGDPGGAQAALARDELVAPAGQRPDDNRLEHPAGANGVRQLAELGLVEAAPWLARVRIDQVDGDLAQPVLVSGARQDRGEPSAHAPAVIGHLSSSYDLFDPHALGLELQPRAATSFASLRYAALPAL